MNNKKLVTATLVLLSLIVILYYAEALVVAAPDEGVLEAIYGGSESSELQIESDYKSEPSVASDSADEEPLSSAADALAHPSKRPSYADRVTSSISNQYAGRIVREAVEKRTANSKHYLLDDGQYMQVIGTETLHYEDQWSQFQDIRISLVESSLEEASSRTVLSKESARALQERPEQIRQGKDASFRLLQGSYYSQLSKQVDQGYSLTYKDSYLGFVPMDTLQSKGRFIGESENRVLYPDTWLDTDLELEVLSNQVKETIIMKSALSPTTYRFQVLGELEDDFTSGSLRIAPAWLEDATGIQRDVEQTIHREGENTFIELTVDTDGLAYPILVDPTVHVSPALYAQARLTEHWIGDGGPQYWEGLSWLINPSSLQLEYYYGDSSPYLIRTMNYLKLELPELIPEQVVSVELEMEIIGSDRGGSIQLSNIGIGWDSTTGYPPYPTDSIGSVSFNGEYYREFVTIDLTNSYFDWINGHQANNGIHVSIPNDIGNLKIPWVYYKFVVVYTELDYESPTAPTNLSAEVLSDTQVKLTWNASTDNVAVTAYDIYRDSVKIGSVSGSITGYTATGLSADWLHTFTVRARDVAGNISGISNPVRSLHLTGTVTYLYDERGRLIGVRLPSGQVIQYQSDANGNTNQIVMP